MIYNIGYHYLFITIHSLLTILIVRAKKGEEKRPQNPRSYLTTQPTSLGSVNIRDPLHLLLYLFMNYLIFIIYYYKKVINYLSLSLDILMKTMRSRP